MVLRTSTVLTGTSVLCAMDQWSMHSNAMEVGRLYGMYTARSVYRLIDYRYSLGVLHTWFIKDCSLGQKLAFSFVFLEDGKPNNCNYNNIMRSEGTVTRSHAPTPCKPSSKE